MSKSPTKTKTNPKAPPSLLPEDTAQALKLLITISEKIITLAERESQVLVQGDMVSFSILQNEKDSLSKRYARASSEFRARLSEFRNADQGQLTRLENLQRRLGDITQANRDIVERLFARPKTKGSNPTLISIQELAQQKPVKIQTINGAHGQA